MKKWYLWFGLALIYAIGGVINYFDGKSITAQIIQVSIVTALAFVQLFCDRKGEKGKKIFNFIALFLSVILLIWIIVMIAGMFL